MSPLLQLWLPILLSAVFVFIASSIIWMVLPIHKHDYKDPGEKERPFLEFLRTHGFGPGVYSVPWCHGKDKAAAMERAKQGPWAMLVVMKNAPNMGKLLGLWMLHLIIIGVVIGYILTNGLLAFGSPFLLVFRLASTAALLAHAGYALPQCIWHGQPWSQLPGRLFDGVVYALITGATFAWLWPTGVGG